MGVDCFDSTEALVQFICAFMCAMHWCRSGQRFAQSTPYTCSSIVSRFACFDADALQQLIQSTHVHTVSLEYVGGLHDAEIAALMAKPHVKDGVLIAGALSADSIAVLASHATLERLHIDGASYPLRRDVSWGG